MSERKEDRHNPLHPMISDPRSLIALIQVTSRHWHLEPGTDHRRRQFLRGIYHLAEMILDEYQWGDDIQAKGSRSNLELVKTFAEEGVKGVRDFRESFGQILDSADRALLSFPVEEF